ncbi:MAG: hypothetical protein SNJ52_00450, partial [Verrucomicrobiia bacterium]
MSSTILFGLFAVIFAGWLAKTGFLAPLDAWWFAGVLELMGAKRVPEWLDWALIGVMGLGGALFSRHPAVTL